MPETTPAADGRDEHVNGPKEYRGRDIMVTFDSHRCLHAGECVRGLPEVFDTAKRPWIAPDAADTARVAEVVRRCPSGALHYTPTGEAPEPPPHPTEVVAVPGGPLLLRGHLVIRTAAGKHRHETRAALCRCGHSANQPFCDGSNECLLDGKTWV